MNNETSSTQTTEEQKVSQSQTVWERLIALAPPDDKPEDTLQQNITPQIHHASFCGQNHLGRGCPND